MLGIVSIWEDKRSRYCEGNWCDITGKGRRKRPPYHKRDESVSLTTRATQASPIDIKLRNSPASVSCGDAWTTPTLCQLASADTDHGVAPWGTADACLPASALPPAAVPY